MDFRLQLSLASDTEAYSGHLGKARELTKRSVDSAIRTEAALTLAVAGDAAGAESLVQDLNKQFPLHTQMQSLWLPAIRAQLALNRKNSIEALNALQLAAPPIEFGDITFVANVSCLYPTYVRGEAYLDARQAKEAAAEFQKILDHSGIVWNCSTGTLARLGVGACECVAGENFAGGGCRCSKSQGRLSRRSAILAQAKAPNPTYIA